MMPAFFLAGLEGQGFEDLYLAMAENGVDLVVDIRLPRDLDLEGALEEQNALHGREVGYQWLKYFGNPFADRDDPIESYKGYLMGMDKELEELYYLIMRHRCCIVDGEAVPERSFRMALAGVLKEKYGVAFADLSATRELLKKYGAK